MAFSFSIVLTALALLLGSSRGFQSQSKRYAHFTTTIARTRTNRSTVTATFLSYGTTNDADISANEALQRTASHLQKLRNESRKTKPNPIQSIPDQDQDHAAERDTIYQDYLQQSANTLKEELKKLGLPRTGRKPDLANRLVDYNMKNKYSVQTEEEEALENVDTPWKDTVPGEIGRAHV